MYSKDGNRNDLILFNKADKYLQRIELSYNLIQQALVTKFPADIEASYEERLELFEDEWEDRQKRRMAQYQEAEQFKLLFIDGLRSDKHTQEQPLWRQQMLYRLAGLFELAAIIDPTAVESLASKIGVSYKQGAACAVLKTQADDLRMKRRDIEEDLAGLDAWWHDPQSQLSERVIRLLDKPIPFANHLFEKYQTE